jgi:opioid growth factor receptor-like protein
MALPLPEPSGFNLAAPVLNWESIQEFRTRPDLQEKLRVSFRRMMNFYGLEARSGEQITVNRAPTFAAKATSLAFSGKSQSSADHENPEVFEPSRTGSRGKSILRLLV